METVKFSKVTNFTGRNGFMKCAGVEFMRTGDQFQVILTALTSRNQPGRCDLYIPVEDVPAVVEALVKEAKKSIDPVLFQRVDADNEYSGIFACRRDLAANFEQLYEQAKEAAEQAA